MLAWLKSKKKVTVEAICELPHAIQYFPIRKASTMMPDWWKKLPRYSELPEYYNNMKKCRGLLDLYTNGFVIPLWTDIAVEIIETKTSIQYDIHDPLPKSHNLPEIRVHSADSQTKFEQHDIEQSAGMYDPTQWIPVKIISPWIIESDLKFAWMEPTYGLGQALDYVRILPGVIDFSLQPWTNINMLIKRQPGIFMLPANLPLVHLVPLTESQVEIRCIDDKDRVQRKRETTQPWTFRDAVSKRTCISKDLDRSHQCPYHQSKRKIT